MHNNIYDLLFIVVIDASITHVAQVQLHKSKVVCNIVTRWCLLIAKDVLQTQIKVK